MLFCTNSICNSDTIILFVTGTDQGSSMVGVHNGAGAILRREHPHLVTVSCTNHALQLACATATKNKIPKEVSCVLILIQIILFTANVLINALWNTVIVEQFIIFKTILKQILNFWFIYCTFYLS